jgi:sulfate transport system permease protein
MSAPTLLTPANRRARLLDTARRRALIVVVVGYAAILVLAPVAALLGGAFSQGLGAVVTALTQPDVLHAFALTLEIAAIVVVVHAIFGTIVAWVLARHHFWGRSLMNGLIDLPFAVSAVVVGYMLLLIFGRTGLLGPVLDQLGIKIAFAAPGMVLATLFVSLPFMVRELLPVLQAFGVEQEQAAATLGASGWQTFWWVTFPALRWGFWYGIVLTFARALGEFGAVLVIGGAIQGLTETATLFIFRSLDQREYVAAYSVALVLGLLSLALVTGIDFVRRRER